MTEIETLISEIAEMELAIKSKKARLSELPAEMWRELQTDEQRALAATYLYWAVDQVSAEAIKNDLLPPNYDINSTSGAFACSVCQGAIVLRSRSHYRQLKVQSQGTSRYNRGGIECEVCAKRRNESQHCEWVARERAVKLRREGLRTMPYREYLQTPEWQERRRDHLKSVGFRCQVCNGQNVTLHVHHRTYDRRGNESYKDLFVLCEVCHSTFHEKHKLAK